MCLLFCLKQTRWGAGPGPVVIDREWCVLTWRIGVGLEENFSGRKMKGVISRTTGCLMKRKGSRRGLSWLRPNDWIIP